MMNDDVVCHLSYDQVDTYSSLNKKSNHYFSYLVDPILLVGDSRGVSHTFKLSPNLR